MEKLIEQIIICYWIGQGLTDEQKKRADINGDGKIDRSDLSELGKLI